MNAEIILDTPLLSEAGCGLCLGPGCWVTWAKHSGFFNMRIMVDALAGHWATEGTKVVSEFFISNAIWFSWIGGGRGC